MASLKVHSFSPKRSGNQKRQDLSILESQKFKKVVDDVLEISDVDDSLSLNPIMR